MKKQEFRTIINAPREKVWDILIGKDTYPVWTSVFSEDSQAETDWQTGSRALFTDGKGEGMVSEIAENKPFEYLSIRHLGVLKDGKEDLNSVWSGSLENYTLRSVDGKTEWIVDMDTTEEYTDYFLKTWPLAMKKVKELAESE